MKAIYCNRMDPATGCDYVAMGDTEQEVLEIAKRHAKKDHGVDPTPELIEKARENIEEE